MKHAINIYERKKDGYTEHEAMLIIRSTKCVTDEESLLKKPGPPADDVAARNAVDEVVSLLKNVRYASVYKNGAGCPVYTIDLFDGD